MITAMQTAGSLFIAVFFISQLVGINASPPCYIIDFGDVTPGLDTKVIITPVNHFHDFQKVVALDDNCAKEQLFLDGSRVLACNLIEDGLPPLVTSLGPSWRNPNIGAVNVFCQERYAFHPGCPYGLNVYVIQYCSPGVEESKALYGPSAAQMIESL